MGVRVWSAAASMASMAVAVAVLTTGPNSRGDTTPHATAQ